MHKSGGALKKARASRSHLFVVFARALEWSLKGYSYFTLGTHLAHCLGKKLASFLLT